MLMSWYKKSYNRGIPLMDEYSEGYRPPSSSHKKDPRSLVNAKPFFGGQRDELSRLREDENRQRTRGKLPGEAVLMDDGGDSHEGLGDRFVAQDEFNTDNDKLPINSRSQQLDNIDIGPHNMQKGNIFKRIKKDTKINKIRL